MTVKRYMTTEIISKTMSVHQCPAIDLADLECLPTVDGDVAARCSTPVGVRPSSVVGLADLECTDSRRDVMTGSSMSVVVQPSSTIAYNLLY